MRERKAKDDVESCSREGHERVWFEKAQEHEKWRKLMWEANPPLRKWEKQP